MKELTYLGKGKLEWRDAETPRMCQPTDALVRTCRIVGFHWSRGTPLPLWDMYARNLSIETGLVNARALLPELLTLAKGGRLHPELVTSTLAEWSDAPEALLENCTKVIVSRPPLHARFQVKTPNT